MDQSSIIHDAKGLFKRGIISRRGPRDNMTDCENDIILIHIPSKTSHRFWGTLHDRAYRQSMIDFIMKHEEASGISAEELLHFTTTDLWKLGFMKD